MLNTSLRLVSESLLHHQAETGTEAISILVTRVYEPITITNEIIWANRDSIIQSNDSTIAELHRFSHVKPRKTTNRHAQDSQSGIRNWSLAIVDECCKLQKHYLLCTVTPVLIPGQPKCQGG